VEQARHASEEFKKQFSKGELPSDLETKVVPAALLKDGKIGIMTLIKEVGFASSGNEAKRLVQGGGVRINGEQVKDFKAEISLEGEPVLKVGKLNICRVKVG
jgi:tyrosyl-tRNA synthetase